MTKGGRTIYREKRCSIQSDTHDWKWDQLTSATCHLAYWPRATYAILLGHMCFSCYRTYVMILCNWLILWQNALYLYLGRLRIVKLLQETTFQDLVLKPSSLFKKSSKECKIIKARQLVDTCSTPPICRGLRISDFNSNFLGIRESVYEPFFLLTLDI